MLKVTHMHSVQQKNWTKYFDDFKLIHMIATLFFFLVFLLINQMQHPKIPQCKIEYNLRLFLLAHNKDYGFMSNSK